MGLYGLLHSWLASLQAKALAERWLGVSAQRRWYRLAYNVIALVTFVPVLALPALLPDRTLYTITAPASWILRFFQALGAVVVLIAAFQTGAAHLAGLAQLLDPASADRAHALTTAGLYHWVRHPIYTGAILFLWATPTLTWNLLAFNLAAALYFAIGAVFEERKLVREFGQAYVDYRRRTPMLVPGIKSYRR
jgi:protein-S-isoprenylcysteine O-methyltransferase Ste14